MLLECRIHGRLEMFDLLVYLRVVIGTGCRHAIEFLADLGEIFGNKLEFVFCQYCRQCFIITN